MSGNIIRINGSINLEWYVEGSKMEDLINFLNTVGFKRDEVEYDEESCDLNARIGMLESVVEDNYTRIDILEALLYKEYSDKKIVQGRDSSNTRW